MENIDYIENFEWENIHQNQKCVAERFYDVWNRTPLKTVTNDNVKNWQWGLKNLQDTLKDAEESVAFHKSIRGIGSSWSLSAVGKNDKKFMANTMPLDIAFVGLRDVEMDNNPEPDKFVLSQCGATIGQLNKWLEKKGLALSTTGASDGQTIVGAMSTGTHGAAINFGSIPDYIYGIHLITASNEHYWIEGSQKMLSDFGVGQYCKEDVIRINDDDIFNSCLVSFGSFGLIFSVLIKAEKIYQLQFFQIYHKLSEVKQLVSQPNNLSSIGLKNDPYHFELFINPYKSEQIVTRVMYKIESRDLINISYELAIDLIELLGKVADKIPSSVPHLMKFIDKFLKKSYPEYKEGKTDMPFNIFTAGVTGFSGKGMSIEIGVDLIDATKVLDLIYKTVKETPLPGLVSLRYVKKSKALFSLAKWETTVAFEIPASFSKQTEKFYNNLWTVLDENNITYTFHWGQMNNLNYQKIEQKWGHESVQKWLNARRFLLKTPQQREMFSNDFLVGCGLNT